MNMLLILVLSLSFADLLTLSGGEPVEGRAIRLELGPGAPDASFLKVVYRPNSETSVEEELRPFKADGSVMWTPAHPGIASLIVVDAGGRTAGSKDVAIRFAGIPAYGIAVMLLAGLLLFGGAGWSLVLALRRMPVN